MKTYWRNRLVQILFVAALGILTPTASASATLECDGFDCAIQCGSNRGLCLGQLGTIVDNCTGMCLGEGNQNDCDGNECDYCLTCDIPPL